MELYIKKAKLTVLDKYEVTDRKGSLVYDIRGELISAGKRLRINSASGTELASVYEKKLTARDRYIIATRTGEIEVFKIDTVRKVPEYRAKQIGWTLKGDFRRPDLKIMEGLHTVAHIKPRALSFGEILRMDLKDEKYALAAVALLLVSRMDMESKPDGALEK